MISMTLYLLFQFHKCDEKYRKMYKYALYIHLELCKLHLKYFYIFLNIKKAFRSKQLQSKAWKRPIAGNRVAKLFYHKQLRIGFQTAKMCHLKGTCLIYPLFGVIEIHCSHPAPWQVFQLSGHKIYPSAVFYSSAL